jgi:DNA-binding CsgD family transcriptional regulator
VNDREILRGSEPEPLTGRERTILRLMAYGRSVDQAAADLCISRHTVRFHRTNVLWKLGATNPAHAVAIGYDEGILR